MCIVIGRGLAECPMGGTRMNDLGLDDLLTSDPEVMAGRRVFRGTRVPVEVLFENLADGLSLDEILDAYESLNRGDVVAVLTLTSRVLADPQAA